MIHYYGELALWLGLMFLAGCPLGALARALHARRQISG